MTVFPQMLQRPDLGSSSPRLTCPGAWGGVTRRRTEEGSQALVPRYSATASLGVKLDGVEGWEKECSSEEEGASSSEEDARSLSSEEDGSSMVGMMREWVEVGAAEVGVEEKVATADDVEARGGERAWRRLIMLLVAERRRRGADRRSARAQGPVTGTRRVRASRAAFSS